MSSTDVSAKLFADACALIPGGVNSPLRAFTAVGGTPRFITSAEGYWLTDADGNTLLMLAAYHDQPATVAALVERVADLEAQNRRGQSPLAGAVFKQADEVVRVLLEAGADPDAGTPSARQTAQMFGRPELFGEPA